MSYFYIASPYTHERFNVVHRRYMRVLDFTTFLLSNDVMVYSPIVHSHQIFLHGEEMRMEFDFWEKIDRAMLEPAEGLIVFQTDGWRESKGVSTEIDIATKLGKPVRYSADWWPEYDHYK